MRFKIAFGDKFGSWDETRRRRSLPAALCRANTMAKSDWYKWVKVIDTNSGRTWSIKEGQK